MYAYTYDDAGLIGAGISLVASLVYLAILVTVYVVNSLAFQKCLRHFGYPNAYWAWIPFLNFIALTECTGMSSAIIFGKEIPMSKFKYWFPIVTVASAVCCCLSIPGIVIQLICCGWMYTTIYDSLDGTMPKHRISAIGVLSGLIPIIAWVKFFSIKD